MLADSVFMRYQFHKFVIRYNIKMFCLLLMYFKNSIYNSAYNWYDNEQTIFLTEADTFVLEYEQFNISC